MDKDKNKQIKSTQKEINLEDLEKVTGGSLDDTSKKETDPVSPETQQSV